MRYNDVTIEGGDVTATGTNQFSYGICSANSDVNINGGDITVEGDGGGTNADDNVTINDGTVNTKGSVGIYTNEKDITINDGKVTATSGYDGIFASEGNVTINGGDVTATGTNEDNGRGIYAKTSVMINDGKVTATGSKMAIDGTVKNKIAGTGWKDAEGKTGREKINVNTDTGKSLTYKKVQFPEVPEPAPSDTTPVGSVHNVSGSNYVVTSAGTVSLIKAKSKKSFTLPAAVSINGKTFNVTGIYARAFSGTKEKTLIVKTKGLTKASVKGSLKGSKVKKVKVKVGKKKENKQFVKRYRKIFTKKNCGKKVRVRR